MAFARFTTFGPSGRAVWINPDHVVFVQEGVREGSVITTAASTDSGKPLTFSVASTVDEVLHELEMAETRARG
jgi:hypothetical protein